MVKEVAADVTGLGEGGRQDLPPGDGECSQLTAVQKRSGEWLLQPKIQNELYFRFSLLGCVLFEYLQQQKRRSGEWSFQQNVQTNFTSLSLLLGYFPFGWK